jgi:uncharacterized membrane protein
MNYPMDPRVRKRILMFYFAAGINIVMAMYVVSVGSGSVSGGTLGLITVVFLGFAVVNFYFAKHLKKRWEQQVRQHLEKTVSGGQSQDP